MPDVRWHYTLVLATLLPLSAAAQTTPENDPSSPNPGQFWAASPLERVLARSGELDLTSEQVERLNAGVERWKVASAEPLSTLRDAREARQGRDARQGREAREGREGREGMREPRHRMAPRGSAREERGPGDAETRSEVRAAMTALRGLRQEQMTVLREVLTDDQRQSLRREMTSAREARPGRWGPDRPGPRRPGRRPQPRTPS